MDLINWYIDNDNLNIEKVMSDYTPYIYKIIANNSSNLNDEDIEEIISDVFLALWNNKEKLDKKQKMSSYLAGITNNLIHKKLRDKKEIIYIEDLKEDFIEKQNIEIEVENTIKSKIIMNELNKMKKEDRKIFELFYYHSKKSKK